MLKTSLLASAAAGALIAASAFTPAAAQHSNWDWNNRQDNINNPTPSATPYNGYYRGPAYGYGYGYDPMPASQYYRSGPSFYIGVGPAYYGPRHYHW